MCEAKLDISFQVTGKTLPVDHGYLLYSAISKVLKQFHSDNNIQMGLIRGRYIGNGILDIQPKSELILRLPQSKIGYYINLAGNTLDIGGHHIHIGVPRTQNLVPAPVLYSHLVTTKHGNNQTNFEKEIQRRFEGLYINGKFQVGRRRTFCIHGKQIIGYSMLVYDLTAEESIKLQETGLGGRSKMGCGFFKPFLKNTWL